MDKIRILYQILIIVLSLSLIRFLKKEESSYNLNWRKLIISLDNEDNESSKLNKTRMRKVMENNGFKIWMVIFIISLGLWLYVLIYIDFPKDRICHKEGRIFFSNFSFWWVSGYKQSLALYKNRIWWPIFLNVNKCLNNELFLY